MSRFSGNDPDVLSRTVTEISGRFRDFLLTGRIASRDGFLQGVDPVVKLLGVFALIITTVATRDPAVLCGLFAVSLGLARLSAISLRLHVSRWVPIVVLSSVVVLPQLFLIDGRALLAVDPLGLAISSPGTAYVLTFVLRVTAAVSFLSLVILTTNFDALVGVLRRIGVPETIVSSARS